MATLESYKSGWKKRFDEEFEAAKDYAISEMAQNGLKTDDKEALEAFLGDEEVQTRLRAQATFRAVVKAFKSATGVGQMALVALWNASQDKLHLFIEESESIWDAIQHELEGADVDRNYIKAMCLIIDRGMFDFIHTRELQGNPVKVGEKSLTMQHESDTEFINPLSSPGMIGKFKDNSALFATLSDDEKAQFIATIFTQSRANIKLAKAAIKGDDFHFSVKVKEVSGDKVEVTFPGKVVLDAKQFRRLKSKLKGILEIGS